MTESRIIEMAIKPPFKYFIQKNGHFGGGLIPDELCFNSLSKAKEICEKLWLENKILTSIFRVYYINGDWQQRAGWLCDRILTIDVDCDFIRNPNDLQIHVAFLWNYHVRKWNPKLYDKIKEVAYKRLELGADDINDWEEIKQELGLVRKQVRKDTVKDTFKADVKQLCRKVEKQFDKFILANEELTLCVQKKYPKIRAEYAVFDRMVMFTEEDEKGFARKEFQTLEEVEEYYREEENTGMRAELDAIDKAGEHVRQQINNAFKDKPSYAELEKENTELKEELRDANEKVVHLSCNQNKDLKRNITKAKEVIKKMLYEYQRLCLIRKETIADAEQFLKEIEK